MRGTVRKVLGFCLLGATLAMPVLLAQGRAGRKGGAKHGSGGRKGGSKKAPSKGRGGR